MRESNPHDDAANRQQQPHRRCCSTSEEASKSPPVRMKTYMRSPRIAQAQTIQPRKRERWWQQTSEAFRYRLLMDEVSSLVHHALESKGVLATMRVFLFTQVMCTIGQFSERLVPACAGADTRCSLHRC